MKTCKATNEQTTEGLEELMSGMMRVWHFSDRFWSVPFNRRRPLWRVDFSLVASVATHDRSEAFAMGNLWEELYEDEVIFASPYSHRRLPRSTSNLDVIQTPQGVVYQIDYTTEDGFRELGQF